ncbi:sn-1 acyl-lipid omega-3 desaturase (ferredoxin)-like [Babylonia areolata]|uniref:sn-1 acyl-lipid omega-3 desaturase (ferredoxin)-like n=1 Tax=Babylonia areolata TaxID=304850 RepID=UPI003FCF3275
MSSPQVVNSDSMFSSHSDAEPPPPTDGAPRSRPKGKSPEQEEVLKQHSLPPSLPSLGDIKQALPSHVFESRVSTSLYYVGKDLVQVAALYVVGDWVWSSGWVPAWLTWWLIPAYWLLQGTLFWALFVLGHDAGHSSFSRYSLLNDAVGNVLHSFLLCPYYCWKLSHRQHHAFTGNMDKDEVFYPIRQKDDNHACFLPVFGFGASWFAYLFSGYHPRSVNHFNPIQPLFSRHVLACILSITMVILWSMCLFHYCLTAGLAKLLVLYAVPEFVFASYLVLTTFLHHTDEHVPWYDNSMWDFVRGQLSSVDRDYGWCHDLVHNIGTHQIHHLFSTIPHYHLEEATAAFRHQFPHLVRKNDERVLPAFFRMFYKWVSQRVVPDSTLVHVYT